MELINNIASCGDHTFLDQTNYMRVLQLIGSLSTGGYEILVLNSLKYAKQFGIKYFVVYNQDGNLGGQFKQSSVQMGLIPRKSASIIYIIKLIKFTKDNHIQIIHAHNPLLCVCAILTSLFTKVKVVYTNHGYLGSYIGMMGLIKHHYKTFYYWVASKYAQVNIFVSNSYKRRFVKDSKIEEIQNPIIVYNGIDVDYLNSGKSVLKKELGLPNDSFLMGMVGNFVGRGDSISSGRDQLTICYSLPYILMQIPRAYFVFIGKTDDKVFEQCKEFIVSKHMSDKVFFLGSRTDIPDILASLDLFVYSSLDETFGIAVIESIISGTVTLVNDLEVFQELSDQENLTNIFKTKDTADLSNAVYKIYRDYQYYLDKAKTAAEKAIRKYSIYTYMQSMSRIYHNIV